MQSAATTVDEYLLSLPEERRHAVERVREEILRNLPEGYEEGMQYGMISYYIPFSIYPKTYNGQPLAAISLASQKNYMALYLMAVYGDTEVNQWFREEYVKTGKKLDMGKSCVRFKRLEDLPLELVGQVVAKMPVDRWIAVSEAARG